MPRSTAASENAAAVVAEIGVVAPAPRLTVDTSTSVIVPPALRHQTPSLAVAATLDLTATPAFHLTLLPVTPAPIERTSDDSPDTVMLVVFQYLARNRAS